MYLIKDVYLDSKSKGLTVRDGILARNEKGVLQVINPFWGKAEISGNDAKLEKRNNSVCVTYTQGYDVLMNGKENLQLSFYLEEMEKLKEVHGYIIFIQGDFGDVVVTTGHLYFLKRPDKAVVVLEEGQHISFGSAILKVENKKFVVRYLWSIQRKRVLSTLV